MLEIEKRCALRDTRAFVTPDTVDLLADKLIGIIGDRRMTKMHRYIGDRGGRPRLFPGLRVDRQAYGDGVSRRAGQSVSVYLAGRGRGLEGIGFGAWREEPEEKVARRYHYPEDEWLGQRRDITLVELDGWPGSPGREDSIRVEYWNENGVGQESILVFDDINLIDEIGWDVKGDTDRRVCMWDAFCDDHGMHFEHPDHKDLGCAGRTSTRAEGLAVLAYLARLAEDGAR